MAKGQKTGGRVAGTPNKSTALVKDMILEALNEAGGVFYLIDRAMDNPTAFMTLVGKVLPLQISGDRESPLEVSWSDHETAAKLATILEAVQRRKDGA